MDLCTALDDAKGTETIPEDINFNLPDNFIRPFREDIDSRNEYKTRTEMAIYNERERCFDDFSNLLRQFRTVRSVYGPFIIYGSDACTLIHVHVTCFSPYIYAIVSDILTLIHLHGTCFFSHHMSTLFFMFQ